METFEQIFKSVLGGTNFMTPDILDYYGNDKLVCELSYGSGIGIYMFGCTFVNKVTMEREIDLDTSFCGEDKEHTKKQAMDYIKKILN